MPRNTKASNSNKYAKRHSWKNTKYNSNKEMFMPKRVPNKTVQSLLLTPVQSHFIMECYSFFVKEIHPI